MKNRLLSFILSLTVASAALAATPKYIFYYIGDGMGMGRSTYPASTPVTDSAAAGTALSTGYKTNNGMLGVTPDSAAVTSVAKELFDMGYGVGIVTSVAPDDATPGAFYSHVPKRSMYYEIGKDAASCGYDFIGGANLRGVKDKKGNPTDLMQVFAENNVAVVRGIDALNATDSRRWGLLTLFLSTI